MQIFGRGLNDLRKFGCDRIINIEGNLEIILKVTRIHIAPWNMQHKIRQKYNKFCSGYITVEHTRM